MIIQSGGGEQFLLVYGCCTVAETHLTDYSIMVLLQVILKEHEAWVSFGFLLAILYWAF